VKSKGKFGSSYGQLWWVILLLAIAVILPTVCLLWFMTEAVENERFAVRQKLINTYQGRLDDVAKQIDQMFSKRRIALNERLARAWTYEVFEALVIEDGYDGLLLYGDEGKLIYPVLSASAGVSGELSEEFSGPWQLEFEKRDFAQAAKAYEQRADSNNIPTRFAALIGKSRCLAKLDRPDEAIETCKQVAFSPLEQQADSATLVLIANARLLLAKFLKREGKQPALFKQTLENLASVVYATNQSGSALPADNNLFIAQKILEMMQTEKSLLERQTGFIVKRLRKLAVAEQRSISIAEYFPVAEALADWQTGRFRRLQAGKEAIYGLYQMAGDKASLLLLTRENIASVLNIHEKFFKDSEVTYRLLDDSGRLVAGVEKPESKPFVAAAVGEHFPGWKAALYFKEGDLFEKTARRQVAIYTWAGVLVIGLILVVGGFAGQVVGRQMRLNRLKNDFIATVSHELKTPLSSMRVLVDTLLQGRYRDTKQAEEYLRLTARENERLSRLIDNFLTFSRMERNKQAFDIVRVGPVEIAGEAAGAVQTKLGQDKCKFEVSIEENLPDILADKDALVTVLVNLLDNAYKYSYDEKHIILRVFAEGDYVCFEVTDNGIGMSRRAARKVFNRFYQVDRTLTRRTEGCGLGLSIVKFIVEAHKGTISVESKPGKGSTFIVKISRVS